MTDLSHYDITMSGDDLTTTEEALDGLAGFLRTEEGEEMQGFPAPDELEDLSWRFYRQRVKNRPAIAFCGLPGAGKTLIGEQVAALTGAEVISMGDAIRWEAPDKIAEDSESLGEFAARTREDSPRAIPNWTIDLALESNAGAYVIDGVRSVDDYMALNNFFEDFMLIHVKSEFYTRLERLQERAREGEEEFDAHDLVDRDARERKELGLNDLLTYDDGEYLPDDMDYPEGLHDLTMVNNGDDEDELYRSVTSLLDMQDEWAWRLEINQMNDEMDASDEPEVMMGDLDL